VNQEIHLLQRICSNIVPRSPITLHTAACHLY
jgi:hypothetical protein